MQVYSDQQSPFGVQLRGLRERAGLTQEALASLAGLSPNAVSDLERGRRRRPYAHTVTALAQALQLTDADVAALRASVARRTPDGVPAVSTTYVPVPPTAIIGREDDTREVSNLLRANGPRLLTLTGPGGVGKTRLALEVASEQRDHFPDGVAFVPLASVNDPALVVPTIVQVLGLREAAGGPGREPLHRYLSHRRMLLVLDNMEHLLEAADDVAAVLAAGPFVRLLATSRAPLRVRGERVLLVTPLAVPDPDHVPDMSTVVASPAAELFIERAREANPAFALTRNNAAVVAAICWRLDGLPLALELAAARAGFLGATELLTRLDQALQAAGSARDLPERQRTLRATLDWSHDLLSDSERVLFRRLAVFAGGFTLTAAEVVGALGDVGGDDVLGVLGALVEQSLVSPRASPHDDPWRYAMLEPVRQYALEKLATGGEKDEVASRHAGYFEALSQRSGPELRRAEQAAWIDELAAEHDNLRAALRLLLERGEVEPVAEIGWQIHRFWSLRGHTYEGREWMDRALAEPGALSDTARAKALYVVGMLSFVRGEMERAIMAAQQSATAARAAGSSEVLAPALMGRGLAALSVGDAAAARVLAEALALSRSQRDPSVTALTLGGLARLAMRSGDLGGAARMLTEAEDLSRANGDWFTLAATLSSQALAARLRGDDVLAGALLRESIQHAAELRDAWHIVLSASGLAGVAARHGNPHRATRLLGAVEGLSASMGVNVPWATWQELDQAALQNLREQLGTKPFRDEWSRGHAMTLEDVVAEALADG